MSAAYRIPPCSVPHGDAACSKRADGVLSVGTMAVNACRIDGENIASARAGRFTEIPKWSTANALVRS